MSDSYVLGTGIDSFPDTVSPKGLSELAKQDDMIGKATSNIIRSCKLFESSMRWHIIYALCSHPEQNSFAIPIPNNWVRGPVNKIVQEVNNMGWICDAVDGVIHISRPTEPMQIENVWDSPDKEMCTLEEDTNTTSEDEDEEE